VAVGVAIGVLATVALFVWMAPGVLVIQ